MNKTLREKIPAILADINQSKSGRATSAKLHKIYEHNIIPYVQESMEAEMNTKSYHRSKSLVPDINIPKLLTNKLAKVYDKPVIRNADNDDDQVLLEYYEKVLGVDNKLRTANTMLELTKGCALEPYLPEGSSKPKMRVLTNYQCRPFCDDPDDITRVTAFTKFLPDTEQVGPGFSKSKPQSITKKKIENYIAYDEKHIIRFTGTGEIISEIENPLGRIPFIWINSSEFELAPYPSEADIQSALIIPKTYAHLFYATRMSCHSITAVLNGVLPDDAEWAPDAVIEIAASDDGKAPSIITIKPETDVDESLSLIASTLKSILESKGIKSSQDSTNVERPNATAEIISMADASSYITKRVSFFQEVESELWDLIRDLHNNVWVSRVQNKFVFSDELNIHVIFGEVKPVEIRSEQLERIKKQMEMGLMNETQAMQDLYPHFTDAQIDEWLSRQKGPLFADNIASPVISE